MKSLIIFLLIFTNLTSCTSSFDFYEAENLIEHLKEDSRIYRLTVSENAVIINGQKISSSKEEVAKRNETGFNYHYKPDYLKSINVLNEDFDSFLLQFKKTGAYSIDYEDGKAYFIMNSFLDGSEGYFYSIENLKNTKNREKEIQLHDGNIKILDIIKPNWYNATGWH